MHLDRAGRGNLDGSGALIENMIADVDLQRNLVHSRIQIISTTHSPGLTAADGWNRTYSDPERGAQTEFIERALSDIPRTPEEIAIIANLIRGKPGFVKAARAKDHLTYHHVKLGAEKRAKRGDPKLRMPELIHSAGRWSMPSALRPH